MLLNKFSKERNDTYLIKKSPGIFTLFEKKPSDSANSLTGFTLMELVIVVIIIGILAAIAIPRYGKAVENSRLSEAKNTLGSMRDSLMRYAAENVAYPTDINLLDINITNGIFYNFDLYSPVANYTDNNNERLARATRNGYSVSGGYHLNYWIDIWERGNFTGGAPNGNYPVGADQAGTPQS